nr:MAG TPA: protein of unknown function (DUF2024) [Caudoviricetes sp.]DAN83190.1 MAG TPA: protein of unknown function (DUF2024) [Caudoviricetes sp.]
MKNLQETAAWVNEIVDNAIKTEKKQQSKRCRFTHKR